MAAVAEDSSEAAAAKNFDPKLKPKSEFDAHKLADMFSNLNPLAKEFFPSSYSYHDRQDFHFYYQNNNRSSTKNFLVADQLLHSENNRRRRHDFNNQGRRRMNSRSVRAQQEESIRRTVYVSDIDKDVSEEELAKVFREFCGYMRPTYVYLIPSRFIVFETEGESVSRFFICCPFCKEVMDNLWSIFQFFSILPPLVEDLSHSYSYSHSCKPNITYGPMEKWVLSFSGEGGSLEWMYLTLLKGDVKVNDCRICGDPHSVLRFAFVEFANEHSARAALNLGGTMVGSYPIKVLPSKTAILPVNPTFLPKSNDEWDMCTRTIYCTNIDKKVSQAEVKSFFETSCGEVTRLRLLGDQLHSTRIAFVEFALAETALQALNCSGMILGSQPIRVSPSKTPVRPRVTRPGCIKPS